MPDILKPLDLEAKDLFLNSNRSKPRRKIIVEVYEYPDENGKIIHQTVRYAPKGFKQCRPDENGKWIWNLKGITTILYRLPEVMKAIKNQTPIFFPEGENDCNRLCALGDVATTNPMGAGKWHDNYTEALQGADLIILPDNDSQGHDHANQVAQSVYGVASRIRILELPGEYNDISDWLDNGGTVEQLDTLVSGCSDYEPPPELRGLPPAEVERYFDEFYQDFARQIPSTFEFNESSLSPDVLAGLEQGKQVFGYIKLGYQALIGFMLLLILGIILINRQVKGTTRSLGTTFLTYGAFEYASIFAAKYFAGPQLTQIEIPQALQAWLPQFLADFLAPLEMFSLGLMIAGVVLIIVSIVYKPPESSF
ncbi:hypothetical protein ACFLVS_06810 [Chloroflexota bacterium]